MEMEKLSKDEEQRIISSLEQAIELTNGGENPNQAIRKVAEANSFKPPIVRRMVEAYNTSKTLSHMKSASGEERGASFPLADADAVLAAMYPDTVVSPAEKAAAAHEPETYLYPESRDFMRKSAKHFKLPPINGTKQAEAYGPDPVIRSRRISDKHLGLRKRAEQARSMYRQQIWELDRLVKEASGYFRQLYHKPFSEVERDMIGDYGAVAKPLMDMVYKQARLKESRFDKSSARRWMFDSEAEPYSTLGAAIDTVRKSIPLAKEAARAKIAFEKHADQHGIPRPTEPEEEEKDALLLDDTLDPYHLPYSENPLVPEVADAARPFDKSALLPSLPQSTATAGLSSVLGLTEPSENTAAEALSEATDPVHESQLKAIQTRAMINDFMANDPIISSYDQDDISAAFNQLSQLAPSVAQQPAIARGMLRRMLQSENVVEPHEASQITDVEQKLRKGTPATSR